MTHSLSASGTCIASFEIFNCNRDTSRRQISHSFRVYSKLAIVHLRQHMQVARHHGCDARFMHRCHFSCIRRIVSPVVSHVKANAYLNLYDSSSRPQDESMPCVFTNIVGSYSLASASLWRRVDLISVQCAVRLVRPGRKAHGSLSRKVSNGMLKPCIAQNIEVGYTNRNKWQLEDKPKTPHFRRQLCPS